MTGESFTMRRTRSQFQNESLVLCQENSLLPERCYKLPERCYMMVRSNQQLCSLKNKLDHVTLPLERTEKCNIPSPIYHQIARRWIGSHAHTYDTSAHKDHHTALLHQKDVGCRNIFTSFLFKKKFSLDIKAWSWFYCLFWGGGSHEAFFISLVLLRSYFFFI